MGKSKKAGIVMMLLCGLLSPVWAQTAKYFIEFTDKNNSPYTLSAPLAYLSQKSVDRRLKQDIILTVRDLPVNPGLCADSTGNRGQCLVYFQVDECGVNGG
jgi:hypothetical protein